MRGKWDLSREGGHCSREAVESREAGQSTCTRLVVWEEHWVGGEHEGVQLGEQ